MKFALTTILSSWLLITPSFASEMMEDMVEFIEANSDLKYDGDEWPEVVILPSKDIYRMAYGDDSSMDDHFDVLGLYDSTMKMIYVSDDPGKFMSSEKYIETVIFHELVHHIQYEMGKDETVFCRNQLEADAYILQNKYIDHMDWPEENKVDGLFALMASSCPGSGFYGDQPHFRSFEKINEIP